MTSVHLGGNDQTSGDHCMKLLELQAALEQTQRTYGNVKVAVLTRSFRRADSSFYEPFIFSVGRPFSSSDSIHLPLATTLGNVEALHHSRLEGVGDLRQALSQALGSDDDTVFATILYFQFSPTQDRESRPEHSIQLDWPVVAVEYLAEQRMCVIVEAPPCEVCNIPMSKPHDNWFCQRCGSPRR